MKNIILNCFPTAFSLESFLVAINLKLESKSDEDQLKDVLKKLSSIIIAFDFDLKGQYRSYIDRRFTYEQLLYLCFIKINESKVASFENHMFKMSNSSMNNSNTGALASSTSALNLTNQGELERKLNASDNLSILYFMSKNGDGAQWRLLHSLIGSSIMKYLFLYAFMFKQLESAPSTYVQICGTKFTFVYRSLISQKLQVDEKAIEAKSVLKKKSRSNESQSLKQKEEIPTISQTKLTLNEVFQEREKKIYSDINSAKSVESQLDKFGHRFLNKRVMLYDRNLSTKIPKKYIYSNKDLPANDQTASRIIDWVIFKQIDLQMFPNKLKLDESKEQLKDIILKFLTLHRTCPYGIFLHCYCKNPKNTQVKSKDSLENSILPTKGVKRKRDGNTIKENESTLKSYIQPKFVYCFVRRCLMHVLEYKDKPGKFDSTCPLIGGKDNFKILLKHLKLVLFGLKFDSITMNSLLHGLKQARISYLKSIECHKYKRLVLLAVIRWLFEDYILMVVRSNFFVTDTSNTNSEIFFYTKSDWRRIVEEGLSKSAYKSIYNLEKIRESDLIFYCSQYQSHGMHLGRLLPKNVNNECRVISGCKVYNPCTNKIWSSNFKFITLNSCLRWLIKTDPSLTGFACPGQKDLFRKYSKFLSQNCLNRTANSIKHWNFLKFDLNKCFDSINTKELISYIDQLFRKHLGYDQAYSVVRYTKFRLDVDMKQVRCKYEYLTVKHHTHDKAFANGIADFAQAFENSSSLYRLSNTDSQIFVPLALHDRNINSRRLLDLLKMCVQHVVIKIHNDLYERMNGILQGSVCARNLCDLYLGRIESRLFYYSNSENISLSLLEKTNRMCLNPTNEIICRIVDDYLVISDNAEKIQRVKSMLKNELSINENKTSEWIWSPPKNPSDIEMKSNEDDDNEDFDLSDIVSISTAQCFAWCGFGFDVRTLDIYFNYDKYFDSSSSLNNRFNATNDYRCAFLTFNAKFLRLFCMNLSPLVIDTRVNSVPAILRNIVDLFAISSVRFMIMWRQMPQQIKSNLRLQLKLILNLCHLVNNSVCDKVKQVLDKYFYSTFSLFKFLCLTAYSIIFKRFGQSTKTHCHLLKLINVNLQKLDFLRCIRIRADTIYAQLVRLVDEQSVKFFKCKI